MVDAVFSSVAVMAVLAPALHGQISRITLKPGLLDHESMLACGQRHGQGCAARTIGRFHVPSFSQQLHPGVCFTDGQDQRTWIRRLGDEFGPHHGLAVRRDLDLLAVNNEPVFLHLHPVLARLHRKSERAFTARARDDHLAFRIQHLDIRPRLIDLHHQVAGLGPQRHHDG